MWSASYAKYKTRFNGLLCCLAAARCARKFLYEIRFRRLLLKVEKSERIGINEVDRQAAVRHSIQMISCVHMCVCMFEFLMCVLCAILIVEHF